MSSTTRYLTPNPVRRLPNVFRRNAEAADDQAKPDVAQHLRYAASTLEGAIAESGALTAEDCAPCVAVPYTGDRPVLGPFPNPETADTMLHQRGVPHEYVVRALEEDV